MKKVGDKDVMDMKWKRKEVTMVVGRQYYHAICVGLYDFPKVTGVACVNAMHTCVVLLAYLYYRYNCNLKLGKVLAQLVTREKGLGYVAPATFATHLRPRINAEDIRPTYAALYDD